MRPRPVGRRARGRCNAICPAVVRTCAATTLPAYSADPDAATDQLHTATPIKHVVVVIGENRSFDHVYGTYVPKSGDSILNLLSEQIVRRTGSPGRGLAGAKQLYGTGQ